MLLEIYRLVLLVIGVVVLQTGQGLCTQSETQEQINSERLSYGAKMLSYMNTDVSPCSDFYKYTCGNYFNVNKIKTGLKSGGIFRFVKNDIMDDMHEVLMTEPTSELRNDEMFKKIREIYQACMKENLFEYKKSDVYLKLIESLGGWPALDPNWNDEEFDWFATITDMKKYGVDIIVKETVSDSVIGIEPELFGLVRLNEASIYRPYSRSFQVNKKLAYKIMTMYGVTPNAARKAFEEIIEFGKQVVQAESVSNMREEKITSHTIKSLDSFDIFTYDWQNYFTTVFGENANVSTQIFVKSEDYFQYIPMAFRKKYIRGAANYIFLKFLYYLHHEFRFPKYEKRYCFLYIEKHMEPFLSVYYIRSKYYMRSAKNEILNMISYIRNALKETFESSDWMDESTKEEAYRKLDLMKILFAGEDAFFMDMNDIYKKCCQGLNVSSDDYHGNNLRIQSYAQKIDHRYFIDSIDNVISNASLVPLKVNAYYSSSNKVFIFPGILRMPFYNPNFPMAYNYASIGRILGHELTHGFDYDGRKLNAFGEEVDWWSPESTSRFEKFAECFLTQYNGFRVSEINAFVDGMKTLAENIADNGGLRQAYMGYKQWLSDHPEELVNETLPGLNFTNTEIFFISYGQSFCEQLDREELQSDIEEEHAPNYFRLIGSIQNFNKFSEEFNCSVGSPMNPPNKCVLW